ncbi:PCP reductase family protein [Candidatus Palauibacter sp.]|uniref:PCP reductase family protein n=1 Tax=Candidatus Palauibacter sp. TaxID=3101350 RepID=UPI003AF30CDE
MKFLCVDCDRQMSFEERAVPGDGTMAAVFRCPACGRKTAMLANPMETQLVSSLGVKVGGRTVPEANLEGVRTGVASGRDEAFESPLPTRPSTVRWSVDAVERLGHVPSFVRGMVKKIYTEYARERGIEEMTPAVMDRARTDLGLEGM